MSAQWNALTAPDGRVWIQGPPDLDGYREVCTLPRDKRSERNARLIAAAPELLKALQNLMSTLALPSTEWSIAQTIVDLECSRAALAQAGGDK
ncbi:MAG: hypothetical protein PHQ12_07495 [Chthoniobacteraceae bacterium]|nr:hypothetical protein [Chthoniobacteraceae bacterium]